ncbi:MAG: adenine deaminase [Cyclobacteriaceae bacterium]|nr:adenine deaminase [Cyclobacteriaceae bacterium]
MQATETKITGQVVDILNRRIVASELTIKEGKIAAIQPTPTAENRFILPGFIDAHVHIESSMLVPSEFARLAVVHGTVATVSDPHEIANVLGIPGVDFMIKNGKEVPFKFYFGAPSCVPATTFETAGAHLGPSEVDSLLSRPEIRYLAEMMNWPGVIHGDPEVLAKIAITSKYGKTVDGHAPGLNREQAEAYIRAGIHTDHECVSLDEALHKLAHGMKVIIREGSAARNFDALIDLLPRHEDAVMFCSDDKHPDSLEEGHINVLVKRAVAKGIDVFSVLKAACLNPIHHYGLNVGQLRAGDPADFIVVEDLVNFRVKHCFIDGVMVAKNGRSLIPSVPVSTPNYFEAKPLQPSDFAVKAGRGELEVMVAHDGQLITSSERVRPLIQSGFAVTDLGNDILKLAVVNRYNEDLPALAFIKGFGLKSGALASSVAHDSHNIIVVGTSDEAMALAVNAIISEKGGIAAVQDGKVEILPLPVAGIMSNADGFKVSRRYRELDAMAKQMGSRLGAPYMTLSFMALLVIPSLKLSDKGLFNGNSFSFTRMWAE